MVEALLHPLNIFIVGLGGGFLIPLLYALKRSWTGIVFVLALMFMTLASGYGMLTLIQGSAPIEILTGGAKPPYAINLRMGLAESIVAFSVNLVALFGALRVWHEKYGTLLLYLLLVMGIQGMVMTRDIFNLFVFLEIVSIATYGLLSLRESPAALSATFKFLMATVIASTFFLIGTMLLYAVTGILNIDELIAQRHTITGPIGLAALMFILACLLLELKPFPANGWGLDVYETARSDVAALISGGVSAGVFFAFLNLLPLFENQLELIAALAGVTFLFSNLIALKQTNAQRLLGYSSVGQMALLTIAASLLQKQNGGESMLLVVGGLFLNHLFAKVGLFWLAGTVGGESLQDWAILKRRPGAILVFGILIVAISGLPPFPGFWAKWQLIQTLATGDLYVWIAVVLIGSLLEAAYMFRWFGETVNRQPPADAPAGETGALVPVCAMALLLAVSGYFMATLAGLSALWVYMPLAAGALVALLAGLPYRVQGIVTLAIALIAGIWLVHGLSGLNYLFATILLAGSLAVSLASFVHQGPRNGFYPLLVVLLLALPALPRAATSLEFIFIWEMITLGAYFLILRKDEAAPHALKYLLFSLSAAFFLIVAFAMVHARTGALSLTALSQAGEASGWIFGLLAIGLLIKAAAIGVHVWLPGAYAESDDDVSALLSAVISKVAIFGLLVGTYVAVRSETATNLAHVLGWIGMLTTLVGAMLALRQDDIKRLLAYSSMSQLGYIVAAIALMSHLGWVTALYLVANHLMVKGILFLIAATIILKTGRRRMSELGALARVMPVTCALGIFAMVAMSGLPPLAGFGGKWLLLSAMIEKGWYGPAFVALLATLVGLIYMGLFVKAIFFGGGKTTNDNVGEAPAILLIPQVLLAAGILVVSFLPKLLIEPLSAAIDPEFASTTVWEGMSLEMIYGYWNPLPTMVLSLIASAFLLALFIYIRRRFWGPHRDGDKLAGIRSGWFEDAMGIAVTFTPPLATTLWNGVAVTTAQCAERMRKIYTGNGQTYALYNIWYFLALYLAGGGLYYLWPNG